MKIWGQALKVHNLEDISSLALAYVGDAVFELFVRTRLAVSGKKVGVLHQEATSFVKASAQAKILKEILPKLTEKERAVAKTARNAKVNTVPKNASIEDYHLSTGFEALLGYLYLSDQEDRLQEILQLSYDIILSDTEANMDNH
jgi:ribonuclease-3 family protein